LRHTNGEAIGGANPHHVLRLFFTVEH
jgi:hypothetical protein